MSAEEGARWLQLAKTGDGRALGKLLSWLERESAEHILALDELMLPRRAAFRIGVTGPPGAGKSTLVGQLLTLLRAQNLKVGVMAVDPSSPFTQGAILGDRIRYAEFSLDPGVFIRSLGTRGSLGGLSGSAFTMARAFDVCGYDIVLIETVGVGQTELDVLHAADLTCVVLVPESGDSIQAMKAGLMEIADVFVVNKSDRPGAEGLARELEAAVHMGEAPRVAPVLRCVATDNQGVTELLQCFLRLRQQIKVLENRSEPRRLQAEARALLRRELEVQIQTRVGHIQSVGDLRRAFTDPN